MTRAMIRNLGLLLLPMWVVGCTQGHESFSTEPGKGYGWKDMTETQKEVHNEMTVESIDTNRLVPFLPIIPLVSSTSRSTSALSGVTRIPEQSLKIWFAPYQDSFGNLHEECVVHTVMQTGQWVLPTVPDDRTA